MYTKYELTEYDIASGNLALMRNYLAGAKINKLKAEASIEFFTVEVERAEQRFGIVCATIQASVVRGWS